MRERLAALLLLSMNCDRSLQWRNWKVPLALPVCLQTDIQMIGNVVGMQTTHFLCRVGGWLVLASYWNVPFWATSGFSFYCISAKLEMVLGQVGLSVKMPQPLCEWEWESVECCPVAGRGWKSRDKVAAAEFCSCVLFMVCLFLCVCLFACKTEE